MHLYIWPTDLFLVVVSERCLKTLGQPLKCKIHVSRPPDLRGGENHLSRQLQDPMFPRMFLVDDHSLSYVPPHLLPHHILQTLQPELNLTGNSSLRKK